DVTATYIILIAMMLISLIVITGKALIKIIATKGRQSLEERRQYRQLRKEQMELERQSQQGLSEQTSNRPGRRSWKTFDIEPDNRDPSEKQKDKLKVVSFKDKRDKKKKQSEPDELPLVNLDHLFLPEQTDTVTQDEIKLPT